MPAGLALAARYSAKRVETSRNGRQEPLLRLHIGGHRPKERRLRLIGAVGAPEALNRRVCLPAGLQEVVDPQALVLRPEIGVIAAPGAAGIREDQDTLFVIHEGLGFREVRGSGPVLHHEPCRMPFALAHDAP